MQWNLCNVTIESHTDDIVLKHMSLSKQTQNAVQEVGIDQLLPEMSANACIEDIAVNLQ